MKLSDIKGADVFDVIADCIVPITNIAADEKAMALFKKQVVPKGTDVRAVAIKRLAAGVPPLMRDHKDDLVAILAAVNMTPVDEYAKELTLGKLITDLADLIGDPMFADFLRLRREQQLRLRCRELSLLLLSKRLSRQ